MKFIRTCLITLILLIGCYYCNIFINDGNINYDFETINDNVALKNIINEDNPYNVEVNGNLVTDKEVANLKYSGITYEEQNFNASYNPYFAMLNNNEKKLYNQLYANINNYIETFKPHMHITKRETENAIEAIYADHPEFFWLDQTFTYKYIENDNVVQIILSYNDTIKDINHAKNIFESQANTIINEARKLNTNYEKEKYVHDVLVNNITYDINAINNQSAYSALVNGKTVCAGYARAFQYIMTKLNIPTFYVTGVSNNVAHAWNIIFLEDGYYNVDLTWNDSTNTYDYFNINENAFSKTHIRSGLSINLPKCNGEKYASSKTSSNFKITNINIDTITKPEYNFKDIFVIPKFFDTEITNQIEDYSITDNENKNINENINTDNQNNNDEEKQEINNINDSELEIIDIEDNTTDIVPDELLPEDTTQE